MRAGGGLATIALLAVGCQWGVRSAFHSTDPEYVPARGATPRVYLLAADVPTLRWRSVGFVVITVPAKCGIRGAVNAAAAKGREIGCLAMIEHNAFIRVRSRREKGSFFGAWASLAHDPGPRRPVAVPPPPKSTGDSITIRFACAVPAIAEATLARSQ